MADRNLEIDPLVAILRDIRLGRKTKQSVAANEIGCGQSALSSYENGVTSPQLSFLRTWTKWAGVDLALIEVGFTAREPGIEIRLTQYQTALAMGMLLAEAGRSSDQPKMAHDLREIAAILARGLQ